MLCDGNADCANGDDETTTLCDSELQSLIILTNYSFQHTFLYVDKCMLPYYGGCDYTESCISTTFDVNCGDCLPGYFRHPGEFVCNRKFLPANASGGYGQHN